MNKNDITLVHFFINPHGTAIPTGCLTLIASLKKHNFSVDFRDLQLLKTRKRLKLENMISFFKGSANIIGISCYSHVLPYVIKVAQKIKQEAPQKTIILGGIGPTLVAKLILDNFSHIDIIVLGDGQDTLPVLLKTIKENRNGLDSVKGIAYRKDSVTIFTQTRETLPSLSNSLVPAFSSVDLKPYNSASILLAQGCPFKCPFCCIPKFNQQHKKRDLNIVKEEILYLSRQNNTISHFNLIDEAFLRDKSRVYNFLSFSGKKKFRNKINFNCYGRIDLMNNKIIRDLGMNNFSIYYGIESGSNNVLKKIKKGFTKEQAIKILLYSKKYCKVVFASFIYGFPFESKDDFLSTLFYHRYLTYRKISSQLRLLCPLPGTELYRLFINKLRFSQGIISNVCLPQIDIAAIKKMLIKYPYIFPTFYHYKSPSLQYKLSIMHKTCGDVIS
ncbi:MAG: radical SAM protein [Candidatus Omnitrophota bacterium]